MNNTGKTIDREMETVKTINEVIRSAEESDLLRTDS
jgi:hypothetical protein